MGHLTIMETGIEGLRVIERRRVEDSRGFFARVFCVQELAPAGWNRPVVQMNHTLTRLRGTVRGMHYQLPPYAEMKLVTCLRGAAWDVGVDLRAGSPTFLQWRAVELSDHNNRAVLIPAGVAHGFQALSDDCEMLYLHDQAYAAEMEAGVLATDPRLGIQWPLSITLQSERDLRHPPLAHEFTGIRVAT